MPPSPSLSALDPNTQAFPALTPTQIDRIRPLGRSGASKAVKRSTNQTIRLSRFLWCSQARWRSAPTLDGERLVVIHNPGCFTGEMTMIAGQRCWVHGRVTATGEFLELSRDAMLALVARDAELSEILMRAFILRRLLLIREGSGNVVVMGSRHSAQTLQLREFFSRNGHPYTYIDLDTDRTVRERWTALK